jgi:tRNA modification GTPase
VIAGRPNVGKSSLVNALVGYQRAIVFDQPGTTRDVVAVSTAIDGWPVELADTAGLRQAGDALEAEGIQLAENEIAAADLVLLVFDASQPLQSEDTSLLGKWPDALLVLNKSDLPAAGEHPTGAVQTSALRREGIDTLLKAISRRLVPDPPPPGIAVPFTQRQVGMLENFCKELG